MVIRKGVKKKTYDVRENNDKNRSRSAEQRRGTTINIMPDKNIFNFSVREEESDNNIAKRNDLLIKIIYRKE